MRISARSQIYGSAAALALSSLCGVGHAAGYPDLSTNDFGGIGLMQTPSARFAPDSEFRVGVSTVYPYNQVLLGLQWLPWLETGFRYAEIRNRDYGPEEFSGDQTYKDRSIDFKLRIREERGRKCRTLQSRGHQARRSVRPSR